MSLSPVVNSHNNVRYWFVSNPASVGALGDFRAPDRVAAVVSEDVTDDGVAFDSPAFQGGSIDAVFATMEAEEGGKVFGYIAAKLAGKNTANAILDNEGGGSVVGLWDLADGRVALLAGDRDSDTVQELWDEACRLAKVPPYEEGRVFSSARFSADKVQSSGGELSEVAQEISLATPKPRPRLG